MKLNNKGITLIESIVTIAIIAILFGIISVGMTSTIHYMSESSLIKNTSNDLFASIQSLESADSGIEISTDKVSMVFKKTDNSSLNVTGELKTYKKNYNDNDELSLSSFMAKKAIKYDYNANFYILKDPLQRGNESVMTNFYCVNDNPAHPNMNVVVKGTKTSEDKDYILTNVDTPDKNNINIKGTISTVMANNEVYKGLNPQAAKVVWYKIQAPANEGGAYNVYGYVLPYRGPVRDVTFIFRRKSSGAPPLNITQYNIASSHGFDQRMLDYIKSHFSKSYGELNDDQKIWYSQISNNSKHIYDGERFCLSDLMDNVIFNELIDGDIVYIYCD